jgi:hypothetical protein
MSAAGELLGQRELADALRQLPGRVVKKIMDRWVLVNARAAAAAGRAAAPRDTRPNRNKPESARLWKVIKAAPVRRLSGFQQISRAIAFGAKSTSRYAARRAGAALKGNARRISRGVQFGPRAPRGGHFHLVNLGTRRRQTRSGANRGVMPANPFFSRVTRPIMARAQAEIAGPLRAAYDREIQAEINRLGRRYL